MNELTIVEVSSGIRNKSELVLALLYAGDNIDSQVQKSEKIEGITRLEKLLFLLKKEKGFLSNVQSSNDFNFFPYKMGPWTNEVYDEIDFLESLDLISRRGSNRFSPADNAYVDQLFQNIALDKYQKNSFNNEQSLEGFFLTPNGKEKAMKIWDSLSENEKKSIIDIKKRYNKVDLNKLLRYVYNKFPEYTTESEIKKNLGLLD